MNDDWKDILKPSHINVEQRKKILGGRKNTYIGKLKLQSIFNTIPDSVWNVTFEKKIDVGRTNGQHVVAEQHRNDTLKAFDNSTRNQNVRWKGAVSIFPISILNKLLDFYTQEGDVFLDPFAGHNSRMEASFMKKRTYIGYDVSHDFMVYNRDVKKKLENTHQENKTPIILKEQDSRNIDEPENSVDFVFSSPPYWNIEWYGDEPEQLGKESYENFIKSMVTIYSNCYKALKIGKFIIINVNDFRKGGKYYSYHVDTVNALKQAGFTQYDHIIMKYPNAMRKCFPNQILKEKLMPKIHEHILVFYKEPKCKHIATYPFTPIKNDI